MTQYDKIKKWLCKELMWKHRFKRLYKILGERGHELGVDYFVLLSQKDNLSAEEYAQMKEILFRRFGNYLSRVSRVKGLEDKAYGNHINVGEDV